MAARCALDAEAVVRVHVPELEPWYVLKSMGDGDVNARSRRYVALHPARRQLTAKLSNAKRNFGELARDYLAAHPTCERCGEDRLACLAIHHRNGKEHDDFEVLCHNCHSVEHHGAYTFEEAITDREPLGARRTAKGHGTAWGYRNGCRCLACCDAKRRSRVSMLRRSSF